MSTYAVGDIQGCFRELEALLAKINFSPKQDKLWLAGDLVNRGPQSLATLRFAKALADHCQIVLGNHDLHLLAVAETGRELNEKDTLQEILDAPDRDELLNWLRQQPLLFHDATLNYTMVHAAILPTWDLTTARTHAKEVESVLQGDHYRTLLSHLYGNEPDLWEDNLSDWPRYRFITNVLTRLRYCNPEGRIVLWEKRAPENVSPHLIPWFRYPNRATADEQIIFGHWAALNGRTKHPKLFALDTGCCWGNRLTALRLEDQQLFYVEKQS
ncbi:MAG: symmetrical bis(5'-nucleosyl)-tetraphosphatase [Gammaproteobacteria bacterium]|nr:symmetrical bis(5'-nucleosyl)-tetraphosphatase [Gammaproteobacteria bacterium]